MNRTWITILVILIVIAGGAYFYLSGTSASSVPTGPTPISSAVYTCDKGKTISTAFYEGPAAAQPAEGQPPTPTGTADVSLGGGATTTLAQTISADGARYANADESFVFWSKGDSALVMRDNSMDLDYTNCTTGTTTAQ